MILTVQEVWRRALPPEVRLLAGAAALGSPVARAIRMHARTPAFRAPLREALAIVPLDYLPLLDDPRPLERVVQQLAQTHLAALLVLGQPDERAIRAAEEMHLPLFALAAAAEPEEIESRINAAIAALKDELYQRGAELFRSLTEALLQQQGLGGVIERLAQLCGRPVALEDELHALQHWAPGPNPPLGASEENVRRALPTQGDRLFAWSAHRGRIDGSDPPTELLEFSSRLARIVAPVVLRGPGAQPVAWVSVFGRPEELGAVERLVAARGAAICAIELAKQRELVAVEERRRSDFLDELLAGTLPPDALLLRAAQLGVNVELPHRALVLWVEPPNGAVDVGSAAARQPARLRRAVEVALSRRAPSALIAERADHLLAVVPAAALDSPGTLAGLVDALRARLHGVVVSIGAGRSYAGAEGVRQTYREAQQALAIGSALFGPGRLTEFGELGIYRLLFALPDAAELRALHDETLRPLVERDERGELLHTLEVYLAVNGSATRAAELLHLHRNTLAYRLRRIKEITGADLEDAELRLTFQVALRARTVLRARGLL